jgi:hypothetical protein
MPTNCPPGTILRIAYTTKRGTLVPATCIKDVGKKGKTPMSARLPSLSDDLHLSDYGYHVNDSEQKRESALVKAVNEIVKDKKITKQEAVRKLIKHLNLLSILQRNTNPKYSTVFKEDQIKMSVVLNRMNKLV